MSTSLKVEQKFSTGGLGQIKFAFQRTKTVYIPLKFISTDCQSTKYQKKIKTKLVNIFLVREFECIAST